MLGRRGGDLALAPHISLVVVLLLFRRSALRAGGGGERMINELPRQIPLFPGEWGLAPSRLRLGISLWRSPTRALLLEDGGNRRQTRDSPSGAGPLSLKGLLSPRAPVEPAPGKLPTPLSASLLRCSERGQAPAEKSCWPWPSGAGVRSCLYCFSPLPQVPINGF